jgi:hypothetical protein
MGSSEESSWTYSVTTEAGPTRRSAFGLGGVLIGALAGATFDEGLGAVSAVGIAVLAGPSRKPLA